jgi:hypothetical protein
VAAWKVERLAEIGRNKPPKAKAPPAAGDHRQNVAAAARDWQQPGEDIIPF